MVLSLAHDVGAGAQFMGALTIGMPPPPHLFTQHTQSTQPTQPTQLRNDPDPEPRNVLESTNPDINKAAGGPAPGHPERLIPHIPPEPEEQALWSQLH
ncbi:DUF6059 family protein [Streptomyces bluensis]|uniref:DUF6059 family protein n=1 Tax=Streptomyces bluensis TaxID=33897 RepID=A0ABW6UI21_9ACTN